MGLFMKYRISHLLISEADGGVLLTLVRVLVLLVLQVPELAERARGPGPLEYGALGDHGRRGAARCPASPPRWIRSRSGVCSRV